MYHFYTDKTNIYEDHIILDGPDVNHIRNVLRMREGEELVVCDKEGVDHFCRIASFKDRSIRLDIQKSGMSDAELKTRLVLYQGLPKKDKLEFIVQKAVELGVSEIVPVLTRRVIVRPGEEAKEHKKTERLNQIAKSAAEQSGRGIIPVVRPIISFKDAVRQASALSMNIIPYENADSSGSGMENTRNVIRSIKGKESAGIFIGPEGGFEKEEIDIAIDNAAIPVSLGKRILRTETAGLAALSMIIYEIE